MCRHSDLHDRLVHLEMLTMSTPVREKGRAGCTLS